MTRRAVSALVHEQKELIDDTDKRVLANYILMRFIRHRINNLDKRFERIQNELYKLLYGREEMPARWKFCIAYVNGNLGMSVGSLFVRKYFDSQSKQDMLYLTSEIQKQFQDIVEQVDWLSESTKDMARSKLDAMIHNIHCGRNLPTSERHVTYESARA